MSFRLAEANSNSMPRVKQLALAASQTFTQGALLKLSSGTFTECGTDPSVVCGVAVSGAGAGTGALYPLGRVEFPPNVMQVYTVADHVRFTCAYAGTLPSTVGATYGVTRHATSTDWQVDFAKSASAQVCTLISIDETVSPISRSRVTVEFLVANVEYI